MTTPFLSQSGGGSAIEKVIRWIGTAPLPANYAYVEGVGPDNEQRADLFGDTGQALASQAGYYAEFNGSNYNQNVPTPWGTLTYVTATATPDAMVAGTPITIAPEAQFAPILIGAPDGAAYTLSLPLGVHVKRFQNVQPDGGYQHIVYLVALCSDGLVRLVTAAADCYPGSVSAVTVSASATGIAMDVAYRRHAPLVPALAPLDASGTKFLHYQQAGDSGSTTDFAPVGCVVDTVAGTIESATFRTAAPAPRPSLMGYCLGSVGDWSLWGSHWVEAGLSTSWTVLRWRKVQLDGSQEVVVYNKTLAAPLDWASAPINVVPEELSLRPWGQVVMSDPFGTCLFHWQPSGITKLTPPPAGSTYGVVEPYAGTHPYFDRHSEIDAGLNGRRVPLRLEATEIVVTSNGGGEPVEASLVYVAMTAAQPSSFSAPLSPIAVYRVNTGAWQTMPKRYIRLAYKLD